MVSMQKGSSGIVAISVLWALGSIINIGSGLCNLTIDLGYVLLQFV
jgi:hypothetical protein